MPISIAIDGPAGAGKVLCRADVFPTTPIHPRTPRGPSNPEKAQPKNPKKAPQKRVRGDTIPWLYYQ